MNEAGRIGEHLVGRPSESGTILFDMHIHSCYSADSSIPIKKIVKCSLKTGILPLVCDHNTTAGSVKVWDILRKTNRDLPRLLAEEIMTSDGEIIGLFLQEEIRPFLSAEETLDGIRDQGALSIVPHPFCSYRQCALRPEVMESVIDRIDIIEGFNGRVLNDWDNSLARGYAARKGKPVSAGSDAHTSFELGRTFLCLPPFSDQKDLMRSLLGASVRYCHTSPAIHAVTRLVKAGRRIGLIPAPCP